MTTAPAPERISLIMGSAGVRIWINDESLRHKYPDDVVHEYVRATLIPAAPAEGLREAIERVERWIDDDPDYDILPMGDPDTTATMGDLRTIIRATQSPLDGDRLREAGTLEWLAENQTLELSHYQPFRCDDDDDAVEWRVHRRSGSINDREWALIGAGETPLAALEATRATLAKGHPHAR